MCKIRCLGSSAVRAWFADDDQQLVALFRDGHVFTIDLHADRRDVVEIERDARLGSGHQVNRTGTLVPVSFQELDREWATR